MEKSNLFQLIQALSPVEMRDLLKFLQSPYFNQRHDLLVLYTVLAASTTAPEKQYVWQQLHPDIGYDDQKMRLLMSYLLRLVEQFFVQKELESNALQSDLLLAIAYRKRTMPDAFERVQRELERNLGKQPLRDDKFYEIQQDLQWERFQWAYANNPTEIALLHTISDISDVAYLIRKLRLICLLTAHQAVYPSEATPLDWADKIIQLAEQQPLEQHPSLQVYLMCCYMLRYPNQEMHFKNFKSALFTYSNHFAQEEMHGLYIWAINYCVKQLNASQQDYLREVLDLYKEGLERGYLFENGILSRFTYHNIVAAGLQTEELDWVRYFINEYKHKLEKQYRESSFSFNLARLEYASRRYAYVLELLQKANYRDPLRNLAAKTLLLKTYYETSELEALQSHLDAMRNYIHRKRVLGYHRSNYLNIIKYTEKLMHTDFRNRKAVERLLTDIQQEKVLTEKAYFEKMLILGSAIR
jgi:hypothetical protein